MAYDHYLEDRITQVLKSLNVNFMPKKMMGGLVFMVNGKMCCGIHIDKTSGNNILMLRLGETIYQEEIHKEYCKPMDFTGRPMKGYLFVTPAGFDLDDDLMYWLRRALTFNSTLTK